MDRLGHAMRSISARLVALIVLPLCVVGGLLVQRVNTSQTRSARTEQISELAQQSAAIGRLRALLDLGRSPTDAIVLAAQLGVPP
jgi:hypothetical protein